MRILFLANLHLIDAWRSSVLAQLHQIRRATRPHAVVVAGDLATSYLAKRACGDLRSIFDIEPIALALGNCDLWLSGGKEHGLNPEDILEIFWKPAARSNGIALLDEQNCDLSEVIITGGYGHYDFKFAVPNLSMAGAKVTLRDYEKGRTPGNEFWWNDARMLTCARGTHAEAKRQAQLIGDRLSQAVATGKPVLVALHTAPFIELSGQGESATQEEKFYRAYSGNSLVGDALEPHASHIDLLVCGHTNVRATEKSIHGIRSLNLGSDYGQVRAVLYDTDLHRVSWHGGK